MPDWSLESEAPWPVAGVDEAGRGPSAGPVVAAAVIVRPEDAPDGLDDSKKLSKAARARLHDAIRAAGLVGVGIAEPQEIDAVNILNASLRAMA
ncbi:MAG: ribonuclease HII, partial [Caulobacterales bacterium]|nr:ribonuclease HII [Caulobacterales bacterium]